MSDNPMWREVLREARRQASIYSSAMSQVGKTSEHYQLMQPECEYQAGIAQAIRGAYVAGMRRAATLTAGTYLVSTILPVILDEADKIERGEVEL